MSAVLGFAMSVPAHADDAAMSAKVAVSGIDLSTDAGRSQLDRSIRKAAYRMCTQASTADPQQAFRMQRECYDRAVSSAQRQIAEAAIAPLTPRIAAATN